MGERISKNKGALLESKRRLGGDWPENRVGESIQNYYDTEYNIYIRIILIYIYIYIYSCACCFLTMNNNNNNVNRPFLTHMQMMRQGLCCVDAHTGQLKHKALVDLFKATFGPHPKQCARIWRDLCVTNIVPPRDEDLLGFFAACSFLRTYGKEKVRRNLFHINEKLLRELTWKLNELIASFKAYKIVFPDEWNESLICSVDGTHRKVNEPRDDVFRKKI